MMDIIDFVIVASLMLATLTCYHIIIVLKFKKKETTISRDEYSLLKAILTEFKHRTDEQNKKISELIVKVDLLENKVGKYPVKRNLVEKEIPETTQKGNKIEENLGLSDIEIGILRFISTGPKSSKDVQNAIKKSREHTARLLKNLYSKNLLNRESQGKFFVYSLSEQGRKVIAGS
ncbi:MAG: hypothetical protein QW134_03945 [Nitrososphaeria archaeon]